MTLDIYCKPLRDKPGVLKPLWQEIPETASRLRGRIEAVLDYAKAHDLRSGENPATWKGHLALILPKRQKLSRSHHAALPYHEIPAFVAKLRERDSIPTLALEFVILTVARAGEVLGAKWGEIDLEGKVWIVPASRIRPAASIACHCQPGQARSSIEWPRCAAGILCFPANDAVRGWGKHLCGDFVPAPERSTDSGRASAIGAATKRPSRARSPSMLLRTPRAAPSNRLTAAAMRSRSGAG